jgi:hypothetical protein
MSPEGLETENDFAREGQQELYTTDQSSCQIGRLTSTDLQLSDSNKKFVLGSRWGLTTRQIGRLTVGSNKILTLKVSQSGAEVCL